MSFESVFCMKTVKSRLFKKYLKRRKSQAQFFFSWLAKYKWKIVIKKYNTVCAGAHKVGKVVRFWSNFDPNFPDIWEVWNR